MNLLETHLTNLRTEEVSEKRQTQMIYMWKDGIPLLFHSVLLEEETLSVKYLEEFYRTLGMDALVSLRTKKVFLMVSGFRIPMAGGKTVLHLATEHCKEEVIKYLIDIGFPSLPDEYEMLPEDFCESEESKVLFEQAGREVSANRGEKRRMAILKQLAEKPTADTFREPFLDCYESPKLSLPNIHDVIAESIEQNKVFVIRNFLSKTDRVTLLNLYREHLRSDNQAPNTMSKKGYSLRGTKLETLGYTMTRALNPYAKVLQLPESQYPEIAHGFFVSYDPDVESLDKHRDGGFWTANLCLKVENCQQVLEFETDTLKMEEGMLVLHKGSVAHAVTGNCPGERVNLVFWFY